MSDTEIISGSGKITLDNGIPVVTFRSVDNGEINFILVSESNIDEMIHDLRVAKKAVQEGNMNRKRR